MKKILNSKIELRCNDICDDNHYGFIYQNINYTLSLNPVNRTDRDKSTVLRAVTNQFTEKYFRVEKIKHNNKYLCFKIRHKLNGIPENFNFVATNE
jgi:hypothetical protein